ncbi:MAG: FtsH protease activity modulator HflK [Desulfovibrionaceae bacterium]|nr:FtsH protease activity modulator HflK [Desulfovibrionaceae bacterium]
MTWDWDKLQEKRKRNQQNGKQTPPEPEDSFEEDDDDEEFDQREQERRPNGPRQPRFEARLQLPSGKGLLAILIVGLGIWLLSGIYIVNPDEQGIVLRFGCYDRTEEAGPHYALPYPIEQVYKPKVTQIMRCEVGFRSVGQQTTFQQGQVRTMPEEASMLTGDENIVNVQFSVQYKISNPVEYLFNVVDQASLVRNAAEAAMREVIGNSQIDSAITDGKLKIQNDATHLLQQILNRYAAGVQIIAVQLQDVHPPKDVIDAFKDVASAREDKSRIINEAEAYRNELLPKARGQAAAIRNAAEAYAAQRIQTAIGESARFDALRVEHQKAPKVTEQRLYYEMVEDVLANSEEKVLLDTGAAERVLPYLPLPDMKTDMRRPEKK